MRGLFGLIASVLVGFSAYGAVVLDEESDQVLECPPLENGTPKAGKRVKVTAPEFTGTEVFHTLYLPTRWTPDGPRLPIIFEYTGNYFPRSGSTGRVEDARLGFGLSGGRFLWVSLPYVNGNLRENQVTWWGNVEATVQYAKTNVPRIVAKYNADPSAVFLCGFSRGAIGVNFLGLHDDVVASLWTGFITHDHFDGVRAWGRTDWGDPLSKYREEAGRRLRRIKGRPYLVCQSGKEYGTKAYLESELVTIPNFRFLNFDTESIQGSFPNTYAKSAHNDTWAYLPSSVRGETWRWMNEVLASIQNR